MSLFIIYMIYNIYLINAKDVQSTYIYKLDYYKSTIVLRADKLNLHPALSKSNSIEIVRYQIKSVRTVTISQNVIKPQFRHTKRIKTQTES